MRLSDLKASTQLLFESILIIGLIILLVKVGNCVFLSIHIPTYNLIHLSDLWVSAGMTLALYFSQHIGTCFALICHTGTILVTSVRRSFIACYQVSFLWFLRGGLYDVVLDQGVILRPRKLIYCAVQWLLLLVEKTSTKHTTALKID